MKVIAGGRVRARESPNAAPGTRRQNAPTLKGSHLNVGVRPFQGRNYFPDCSGGVASSLASRLASTLCPRLLCFAPSGLFRHPLITRRADAKTTLPPR